MKVGVYGLGRFGRLWAGILSRRFDVVGFNRSPVDDVLSYPVVDFDEFLKCDVIFLCVAISGMEAVCRRIGPLLAPGTLVMDTCSVKVYPAELMSRYISPDCSLIATHPMFGPDSVGNGLNNLPFIMCDVRSGEGEFSFWQESFRAFGFSLQVMTLEEHDREAAFTQGITHFIGRVLKDLDLIDSPIATLGYRKLLEVMEQTCNDPWQLFIDLQQKNPYTGEMRRKLKKSLDRILAGL